MALWPLLMLLLAVGLALAALQRWGSAWLDATALTIIKWVLLFIMIWAVLDTIGVIDVLKKLTVPRIG